MSNFTIERDLRMAASARGAKVEDRGSGHFQIIGERLVNYWPFSRGLTAHISGGFRGTKNVSIKDAVAMAFQDPAPVSIPPSPLAHLKPAEMKPSKGHRKVAHLFKLQHGLCSICAQPMELVDLLTMPKSMRKRFFKDRERVGMIATIDHTVPKSKARGIDHNLRAAHHACNGIKGDLLIEPYPLPCFESKRLPKIWLAPGVFIEMDSCQT